MQNGLEVLHNPNKPQLQYLLLIESSSFASEPDVFVQTGVFVDEHLFEQSPTQSTDAEQYMFESHVLCAFVLECIMLGI